MASIRLLPIAAQRDRLAVGVPLPGARPDVRRPRAARADATMRPDRGERPTVSAFAFWRRARWASSSTAATTFMKPCTSSAVTRGATAVLEIGRDDGGRAWRCCAPFGVGVMTNVRRSSAPTSRVIEAALARGDRECWSASSACARDRDGARRWSTAPAVASSARMCASPCDSAVVTQIGEVEADPVRRAMNRRNQAQRHRQATSARIRFLSSSRG